MKRAATLAVLLAAGCGGGSEDEPRDRATAKKTCDPTHGAAERVDLAAAGTPSRLKLGPGMQLKPTERNISAAGIGERLEVTGVVRGEDCAPLPGATLRAWQTNGKGRYGPRRGGQDLCCYLTGTVRTDGSGRYTLVSVMPRGYEGGPAHIHMEVGHPDAEGLVTELVLPEPVAAKAFDITLRSS